MEGVAVEPWLMCDLDDRVGDEINRHDVRLADLRADQRQPRGEDVACAADRLEEVVGAVDLVDLAGPRIADHNCRPVDPPRHCAQIAHQLLGLKLGAVVGRRQRLPFVEHLLREDAFVGASDSDR